MSSNYSRMAAWVCAGLVACVPITPAEAVQPPAKDGRTIAAERPARAPLAHIRFCAHHPDQCEPSSGRIARLSDREALALLDTINRQVNRSIVPRPDTRVRGLADEWRINVRQGDCEDYVLEKRKRLLERGWPSGAARVAIVVTRDGIGHAVLVVRVGTVDYVLDNMVETVRPWAATTYRFVKIQSPDDPTQWLEVSA